MLGSEVSGDNAFQGEIKFLAMHSRALSAAQVMQNFNAGVGQRYYLLFDVSNVPGVNVQPVLHHVHGEPVRQLQLPVLPADLHLAGSRPRKPRPASRCKGMRIGINGTIPLVGQAYIPLNMSITAAGYTAQGEVLSTVGTVIGLESGPADGPVLPAVRPAGHANDVIVEASPCPAADRCVQALVLGPPWPMSACATSRR